jgi:hypothetical protein
MTAATTTPNSRARGCETFLPCRYGGNEKTLEALFR